jgi:hypothetical protein
MHRLHNQNLEKLSIIFTQSELSKKIYHAQITQSKPSKKFYHAQITQSKPSKT